VFFSSSSTLLLDSIATSNRSRLRKEQSNKVLQRMSSRDLQSKVTPSYSKSRNGLFSTQPSFERMLKNWLEGMFLGQSKAIKACSLTIHLRLLALLKPLLYSTRLTHTGTTLNDISSISSARHLVSTDMISSTDSQADFCLPLNSSYKLVQHASTNNCLPIPPIPRSHYPLIRTPFTTFIFFTITTKSLVIGRERDWGRG